ncbi:hypothetical protein ABIA33_001385 [Streptacidiphilus sp. MAP12-16]|uniref:hypothetical protein n=1 Tax=Streptacidiphilus sp. MAP12-16 TaxID=3156300 RepID=UPI003511C847
MAEIHAAAAFRLSRLRRERVLAVDVTAMKKEPPNVQCSWAVSDGRGWVSKKVRDVSNPSEAPVNVTPHQQSRIVQPLRAFIHRFTRTSSTAGP